MNHPEVELNRGSVNERITKSCLFILKKLIELVPDMELSDLCLQINREDLHQLLDVQEELISSFVFMAKVLMFDLDCKNEERRKLIQKICELEGENKGD